ncbi:hypothetical protein GCM10016234_01910 [Tianweitania populi]|uniref:Glycosyltransferase n=1 Tax=Tianweitania populi TaxID=1607949 RepID=A0A8J3GK57_9HYPH|nr:hypothetical protein GCM10016234_01910 [Tianweitania populi]
MAAFFQAAARRDVNSEFHIITRDDPKKVREAMGGNPAFQSRLQIYSMAPHEVHKAVQRQSVSAMFFTEGLSKLGSSPTRLGELLGCGIPVVANAGVGDVAQIIERNCVGVLARSSATEDMDEVLDALERLTADPHLPSRCRKTAEEVFSLEAGTRAYRELYASILPLQTSKTT